SPYRETEGMADESDAIADWPLLNALVNTASGASWVSIHHGGGVGIGRSIHAGMVCVADGTDLAAQKLERVLTADPGMGVITRAGLAANQVGELKRILVAEVDDNPRYPYKPPIPLTVMVNPVLEPAGEETVVINEGCLSVPDLRGDLDRFVTVRARYLDRDGV